ncbi:hypothetical protein A1O7_08440, partial [Cladophialophora yegresii CBS 114405]
MGFLGLGEPSWGTLIICLGAWINRDFKTPILRTSEISYELRVEDPGHELALHLPTAENERTEGHSRWRSREISLFGYQRTVETPDTTVFRSRTLSRVLLRLPFVVEIVYWALIYGVYQFGRGQLAIRFVDHTIDIACCHALAVIEMEQRLHIFWELSTQQFFLQHTDWMWWINRIYSFVHLPATISFLVGLYYFAITRNRSKADSSWQVDPTKGPELYESKRRALALCNLLAFCVFSMWPCMPPRLLGQSTLPGEAGKIARSFGFIDTVHARDGAISAFNTKKWTNQLAAMPSLHFGYSLLVGVSLMRLPLAHSSRRYSISLPFLSSQTGFHIRGPSFPKLICELIGGLYPTTILVVIVATANHFILDAVAGGMISLFALRCNGVMKNLLPVEDYVLWCLRIHKPVHHP